MEKSHNSIELGQMLHPACGYQHPSQVLQDCDLTLNEKRRILVAWASDACAVEAMPTIRLAPAGRPVQVDDILDALKSLDRQTTPSAAARNHLYRKAVRERRRQSFILGAPSAAGDDAARDAARR